jgi:SAM-dependent methyltransferase
VFAGRNPATAPANLDATSRCTAEAWTIFWTGQGRQSRCLGGSPEVRELLDSHWRHFAGALPPQSKVLDLGCGAGAVGKALHSAEPRLEVTGIDIAQVPESDELRVKILSNVAMESLPFTDGSFSAAVSQFGYEYGDPEPAAAEMARVLAPRAPFSLLMHHPDGPIVAAMRRHRRAIEGLCGLRVQSAFFSGNADDLADRLAALKRDCPDPILDQAAAGLQAQIRQNESARLQLWRAVADALAPELAMLDSLDLCCGETDINHIVMPIMRRFELSQPVTLLTQSGEPIAWAIRGRRQ